MECSGNNCLFSLSKKFSTRALPQIYAVVRGHPPITLCNKLPSRRERERERNGLCLASRANLVNIYRNHQSWHTWSVQRSLGSTFAAHSGEELSSERRIVCLLSRQPWRRGWTSSLASCHMPTLLISDVSTELGSSRITIWS